MQSLKSSDGHMMAAENCKELELIEMASSSRNSKINLDKIGNKLEIVCPDVRRTSSVSFKENGDLNMRQANARRPTLVSLCSGRISRNSVFSTTSINSLDFKETMKRMKILVLIILIFIFCVFLYNWFFGHPLSHQMLSNSSFIDDRDFAKF